MRPQRVFSGMSYFSKRKVEPAVVVQGRGGPRQVSLRDVKHLLGGNDDPEDPVDRFLKWLGQKFDKFLDYLT